MSVEVYTNNAQTTLTSSYTAGAGSIVVASTAGNFPTTPIFRVGIFGTNGSLKVILKVTTITDGTHFAVTAEGSDANAASGDVVRHLLTAGGMDGIRASITQILTFSAQQALTTMKQGDQVMCTDAPYFCIY